MKKKFYAVALILALCCTLCSCGRKSEYTEEFYYTGGSDSYYPDTAASEGFYNSEAEYKSESPTGGSPSYVSDSSSLREGLKLTYSANISVETLDYGSSLSAILEAISKAGGFVSFRNEGGGYTSAYGSYVRKWVNLECRIPAEKYQAFLDGSGNFGNVTSLLSSMEDITSQYVDTEARLSSLKAQQERLTDMMKKATTVSDLIEIESQLSETIYQIESYTAKKNTYDSLIAYSTVSISLEEVATVTPHAETFGERLASTFADSFRSFIDLLEAILFGAIYLLPFAVILIPVIFLVIRSVKNRKAKRAALAQQNQAQGLPKELK